MSFIGDLTGGLIGTSSAEKAAKNAQRASAAATAEAQKTLNTGYETAQQQLNPYAALGGPAMQNIQDMQSPNAPELQQFSFNQQDLLSDPSYQFRLSQGLQGADRAFARNRNLGAGGRLTGLNDYAQNMASTEYQNAWQRALAGNQVNNATLGQQFQMANTQYGNDMARNQYMGDIGFGAAQRLGDYGYRKGIDSGNLALGHAANSTAADMFQAQSKSNFVSDLMGLAGSFAGGGGGGGGFSMPSLGGFGPGQWADPFQGPRKL